MEELAAAEVYVPRTIQVWRTLLNWLAFFFQIFAQILRCSFLSSATHAPPQFKPLPVVELSEFSEEPKKGPPMRILTPAVPVSGGGERVNDPSSLEKLTEFEGKPKINHVTVFERPGLKELLKQLSGFAELVLFTAGLEGYARTLVGRIDAENQFSQRLYRPSTISTKEWVLKTIADA